ncbi:helix-turn-helix domain-containing protein [Cohnella rhizosphaerae]|uniref:AraC family transcriptional regulator n=1 Tax=Cohnella rhizosphaerae TaxID=1457232 RepID=A0A9X4KWU0_9BACL|nr:AraC family transcriptional regulator [Cohnella rhizosphaerae]MDG0811988.1 AraC family transcriptional regulator [Cohnella rhizosphaerae]
MLDQLWFKLRSAIRIVDGNGSPGLPRSADAACYTLLAVTEGSGALQTQDNSLTLAEGTVYVAEPYAHWSFLPDGEGPLELFIFDFDVKRDRDSERMADGSAEKSTFPHACEPLRIPPVSLNAMSRAVYGSLTCDSGLERFRGQFMFQELLHRVMSEWAAERSDELDLALEHLRAYIEQRYYEPLTIKRLAGLSKISPRHLVQMFKDKYGVTPMDYVRRLRAQRKAEAAGSAIS